VWGNDDLSWFAHWDEDSDDLSWSAHWDEDSVYYMDYYGDYDDYYHNDGPNDVEGYEFVPTSWCGAECTSTTTYVPSDG